MINHINLPDAKGQVYCCLRNRVVRYDSVHQSMFCNGCKMFNGTAGGFGVECVWDDNRTAADARLVVTDPVQEWFCNQKKRVQSFVMEWEPGEETNGQRYENDGEAAV